MNQKDLHFLPFDVYTRNTLAAQSIELIVKHLKHPLKVLDFGGRSGEFEAFIPGQELSVIDIREPETATDQQLLQQGRYFVSSGIQTDLAAHTYDLATAFEVLEHVSPADRQPFLKEMWRVSKVGIIVSAPVDSPLNDAAERSLNSFFQRLTGESHPWLSEHLDNRPLPEAKVIEGYLKDLGASVVAIPNNNTFLWALLQYLAFTDCKYKLDIQKIFAVYNDNFKQLGDNQGEVYRYIYVALKPEYAKVVELIQEQLVQIDLTGDKQLKVLDTILEEFVQQISSRATLIEQKEVHISNLDQELERRRVSLEENNQRLQQDAERLASMERLQAQLSATLAKAVTTIERQESELSLLSFQSHQYKERAAQLKQKLVEQAVQQRDKVQELNQAIADKEQHIQNIQSGFKRMQELEHSFTFKFFRPLMRIGDKVYHDTATAKNILKYEGVKPFIGSFGRYVTGTLKEPIPTAGTYKELSLPQQYQLFLKKQLPLDEGKMKAQISRWSFKPKVSVVVPVYNVKPEWLNACIESVRAQLYTNWELCLYDDASTKSATVDCLKGWGGKDPRIKIDFGQRNLHICGATNQAIKLATGEFVALMDNDDELTVDALYEVVKALNENKNLGFIYSDEDKREMDGTLTEPHFKPDFNLDLLLSINYISHLSVIRKDLGDRLGWFRPGFEGSQDYDLYLRVIEQTNHIHHIQKVLYHWRKVPGSTAARYEDKKYVDKASLRALTEYLQRNQIEGSVSKVDTRPPTFRVQRKIINPELVSIIIPFKDKVELLKMCIPSVLEKTTYKKYEILLVSNNSTQPETFEYVRLLTKAHPNIRLLKHDVPFNYSEINNWAVSKAKGKYVLLMNNDIEVISPEWLTAMVEHIQRPEVGAVGAKLYYPNDTLQHAGVIVGLGGVAGHSHKYFPRANDGYFGRVSTIQDLSACTAACLLVKQEVYQQVGGLDAENLKIAFNDVDFCLRVRAAGHLIVYTPFATLYHHESVSRGQEDTPAKQQRFQKEVLYMKAKYGNAILRDPYYNPNLSLDREDFSLAI